MWTVVMRFNSLARGTRPFGIRRVATTGCGVALNAFLVLALTLTLAALPSRADAWEVEFPGNDSLDVTVDNEGDVFVGEKAPIITKLAGATGTELWRRDLTAGLAIVDSVGDVIAWRRDSLVVKLDGATGEELWMNSGVGQGFAGSGLAVDAAGNIFNAGSDGGDFAIAKLSGATGAELWRKTICCGGFSVVAIDSAGHAIAAGEVFDGLSDHDIAVIKFSGIDGREVWTQPQIIAGTGTGEYAETVAIDGSNDVFVAGPFNGDGAIVVKLSGSTGGELWRQEWERRTGPRSITWVDVDDDGDAIGCCSPPSGVGSDGAFKLSGSTGMELWHQAAIADEFELWGAVRDERGDAILAGRLLIGSSSVIDDVSALFKLNAADGTELWSRFGPTPRIIWTKVTVDGAGDVIAASASTSDNGLVGLVMKLNGSDGTTFVPEPSANLLTMVALIVLGVLARRTRAPLPL